MSPFAGAMDESIPTTTSEIGVFTQKVGARYFSLLKPQPYSVRVMDKVIRDFLEDEELGLSFDFECDKWRWRCCRTLHFEHVEFEISLFRDVTNEKIFIKFFRVAGCSKVFTSTITDFYCYLTQNGMDKIVKKVCPVTLAESPICLSTANKKVQINENVEPMPMTISQLVKSCSSLIQWSENDVNEALPAILSSIPRIWTDFSYHYNMTEKKKNPTSSSIQDAQSNIDEIVIMKSSLKKLYSTLCAIVIQSASLISAYTNHHTIPAKREIPTSPVSVKHTIDTDTPSPILTMIRRSASSSGFSSIVTNSSLFKEPLWSTFSTSASDSTYLPSTPADKYGIPFSTANDMGKFDDYDFSWIDCDQDVDATLLMEDTAVFKLDQSAPLAEPPSAVTCRSIPMLLKSSSVETSNPYSSTFNHQARYDTYCDNSHASMMPSIATLPLSKPTLSCSRPDFKPPCLHDRYDASRPDDFSLQHLRTKDLFTCLFLALGCIFQRVPFLSSSLPSTTTSPSSSEKASKAQSEPSSPHAPTRAHAPMERGEDLIPILEPQPTGQPAETEALNVEEFIHEMLTTNVKFMEVLRDLPALAVTSPVGSPVSLSRHLSPSASVATLSILAATATATTATATAKTTGKATAKATAISASDGSLPHPISTKAFTVAGKGGGLQGREKCNEGPHWDPLGSNKSRDKMATKDPAKPFTLPACMPKLSPFLCSTPGSTSDKQHQKQPQNHQDQDQHQIQQGSGEEEGKHEHKGHGRRKNFSFACHHLDDIVGYAQTMLETMKHGTGTHA